MKRELDRTTRPTPRNGETLDSYIDRWLNWFEYEAMDVLRAEMRRATRKATHARSTHLAQAERQKQQA